MTTPASASRHVLLVQDADVRHYPPTINAAALLAEAGFGVTIAALRNGDAEDAFPPGTSVSLAPSAGRGPERLGRLARNAWRAARSLRPAAIIGYDLAGGVVAAMAALAMRRLGQGRPTLLFHSHDSVEWDQYAGLRRHAQRIERRVAAMADLVVIPDDDRARWYASYHRLRRDPLVVWNCPRVHPARRSTLLRERLASTGFRASRVVLRHQATLGPGLALEAAIASIPCWPGDVGLVLVGAIGDDYRRSLEALADGHGVRDRVAFLPRVPYRDVIALASGAQVGLATYEAVNTSRLHNGGASNKLFEFAAAGVPVVASRFPSFVRIVEGGEVGRCVNPTSPEETGEAIRALLDPSASALAERALARHARDWNYESQFAPVIRHIEAHG